jgi:hypothetical protein
MIQQNIEDIKDRMKREGEFGGLGGERAYDYDEGIESIERQVRHLDAKVTVSLRDKEERALKRLSESLGQPALPTAAPIKVKGSRRGSRYSGR